MTLKYPITVTFDTNIFDSAKYDLSKESTLQLLKKYVDDGIIKVALSDIVIRKSKKHIADHVKKICSFSRKLRLDHLFKEQTPAAPSVRFRTRGTPRAVSAEGQVVTGIRLKYS